MSYLLGQFSLVSSSSPFFFGGGGKNAPHFLNWGGAAAHPPPCPLLPAPMGGGGKQTSKLRNIRVLKARTSLTPLSRFRGSRVITAHAHQCCKCYVMRKLCKDCAIANEIDNEIDDAYFEPTLLGSMTTDTWSRSCDVWLKGEVQ